MFMALEGFEPPAPRLRVWCSNQAELQSHMVLNRMKDYLFFLFRMVNQAEVIEQRQKSKIHNDFSMTELSYRAIILLEIFYLYVYLYSLREHK